MEALGRHQAHNIHFLCPTQDRYRHQTLNRSLSVVGFHSHNFLSRNPSYSRLTTRLKKNWKKSGQNYIFLFQTCRWVQINLEFLVHMIFVLIYWFSSLSCLESSFFSQCVSMNLLKTLHSLLLCHVVFLAKLTWTWLCVAGGHLCPVPCAVESSMGWGRGVTEALLSLWATATGFVTRGCVSPRTKDAIHRI